MSTSFPFVAIHWDNEDKAPWFGQMYKTDEWYVTLRLMTSNDTENAQTVQINHKKIGYIENLKFEELPWNQEGNQP